MAECSYHENGEKLNDSKRIEHSAESRSFKKKTISQFLSRRDRKIFRKNFEKTTLEVV